MPSSAPSGLASHRTRALRWRRGRPPPRRRIPWRRLARRLPVTVALGALTLAFFLLQFALGGTTDPEVQLRLGALRPDRVLEHGELYRLVLPMVLHMGPIHLVLNGLAFVQLMFLTEHLFGSRRALFFYLFCGISGTVATTLFAPPWLSGSVGASGAIMGLAGLLLGASLYGREPWRSRLRALFGRRLFFGVGLTFALGLGLNLIFPLVDNWGHGGGFAGGLLLAALFRDPDQPDGPLSRGLATISVAIWLGSIAGMVGSGAQILQTLPEDQADRIAQRAETLDDGLRAGIMLAEMVRAYHEADQPEEAQRRLRARLDVARSPTTVQVLVSRLFEEPAHEAELQMALERWLELEPASPAALNTQAWHLLTRTRSPRAPGRAEALARRALTLIDDDPVLRAATLDTHAEALFQLDRAAEALPIQEEAVRLGTAQRMNDLPEMRRRLVRIRAAAAP